MDEFLCEKPLKGLSGLLMSAQKELFKPIHEMVIVPSTSTNVSASLSLWLVLLNLQEMAESLILLFKVDGASKKKDVSAFEINTEAAWVKRQQRLVFQCNIFNTFYMINLLSDLIGFTEPKDKCGPTASELRVVPVTQHGVDVTGHLAATWAAGRAPSCWVQTYWHQWCFYPDIKVFWIRSDIHLPAVETNPSLVPTAFQTYFCL